jgi:peptide methionine sulfoxide reductase msrA/msrB
MNWEDVIRRSHEGNPEPTRRLEKTDEEWKDLLTPEQYRVTRLRGTERPFSGELCNSFGPGLYTCVCCQSLLFDSKEKFESGTGWPSFTEPAEPGAITYVADNSHGMLRMETNCSVCNAHLGHVFPDGPAPSGLRFCINSAALEKHTNKAELLKRIVLGGGCFWCTESIFQELKGVINVESGYAGGDTENPTYEQVCSETTGHAEVIRITYDPNIISLEDIIEIHLTTHNPTTLNRQGADIGTSYRSIIFYTNESEKHIIESGIEKMKDTYNQRIVTELKPLTEFYLAESYHQNYFRNNPNNGYCAAVINPKLTRFRKKYSEKLKETV